MTDQIPDGLVWNEQLALEIVDGCISDLKDLLEIWLRQSPRLLSDIRSALESHDAKKLHLAAHTLRGSLQIFCTDVDHSAAAALEAVGRIGQTPNEIDLFTKLEVEIALVTQQVVVFLKAN